MQGWKSRLLGCALCGCVEASGIPVSGGVPAAGFVPAQPHRGWETGVRTSLSSTGGKEETLGPPLAD